MFSNEEEKQSAGYCRDLYARFCGLLELPFNYAERNSTDDSVKKNLEQDCVSSFCNTQNLSIRLSEKCSCGRTVPFNDVQVLLDS
jgi:hypothetical protein